MVAGRRQPGASKARADPVVRGPTSLKPPDPLWFKRGVIYELHVRAFFDSNGDGTGDFRGLTAKLDYLRDLGSRRSGCCRSIPRH